MKFKLLLIVLATSVLSGCVSSVTTGAYNAGGTNNGIVYALPKTKLKVSVPYTIEKKTIFENGIVKAIIETPTLKKTVAVETVLAGDEDNRYVLSGEGLVKDSRLDASFKFQIGTNQLLTSVSTDATDKTPQILEGLVSAGISIAKMAAAGEHEAPLLRQLSERLAAIDQKMVDLANNSDTNKLSQMDALLKEQAVILAYITKYRELNGTKVEEREVVYVKILDLKDMSWNAADSCWEANLAAPGNVLGNFGNAVVPQIKIQVYAKEEEKKNTTRHLSPGDKEINGVFYRVPTALQTKATTVQGNTVLFDDNLFFCQAGPICKVEARYKTFAHRKTAIVFSPTTGSISEYGVESSSSAEALAKSLDTSMSKIQGAVADIQKQQATVEANKKTPEQLKIDELTRQKNLADAEAALIKSQNDLNKLKSGTP